jgi:hypothetical protein
MYLVIKHLMEEPIIKLYKPYPSRTNSPSVIQVFSHQEICICVYIYTFILYVYSIFSPRDLYICIYIYTVFTYCIIYFIYMLYVYTVCKYVYIYILLYILLDMYMYTYKHILIHVKISIHKLNQ